MLVLGFITASICYIEKKYLTLEIPTLTIFHQIAGFIISMVLVFRINTAYDRWWEGRKLWGSLLNNSRNLSLKLNAFLPQNDFYSRNEIHLLISNYAVALKLHLRNASSVKQVEFSATLKKEDFVNATHKPNFIAKQLTVFVLNACKNNNNTQNDYLIVSDNINQLTEICGACERIKSTPIPYSYSIFIKKIIFLYIITMPITFGLTIGYWAVPIVMIMFYAFASLELISEEIEDPFGTDSNDLPTDEIAEKIKTNTKEILLP
jgi:putative membrane protein